jgi:Ulp1 family protease
MIIDKTNNITYILNSMESQMEKEKNFLNYIFNVSQLSSFTFKTVNCPKQTDNVNCGIYSIIFVEYFSIQIILNNFENSFSELNNYNFKEDLKNKRETIIRNLKNINKK